MGTAVSTSPTPTSTETAEESVPDHHSESEVAGELTRLYAFTWDLGEKMQCFSALGLNVPPANAKIYTETVNDVINELNRVLKPTQARVEARSTQDLARAIVSRALRHQSDLRSRAMRESFVVSTCPEIANIRQGVSLQINRLIDENGRVIGLGPRPGTEPIEDQMEAIAHASGGHPVILMEDGAFTGGTMRFVIEKMREYRLQVIAVVIGMAFPTAKEKIAEVFDGEIICEEEKDWLDWMPDHDFFPFVPNSGRVFGVSWRGNLGPLYTREGISLSAPYIQPFAPSSKWASIPEASFLEFSRFCLDKTLRIFQDLCHRNGDRQLTIGDIIDTKPRVSVPMGMGQKRFPSPSTRILDYLKDCIEEID
ncbi:MAG: phosphoribosyltransferase [Patescibacteria group bacterium]